MGARKPKFPIHTFIEWTNFGLQIGILGILHCKLYNYYMRAAYYYTYILDHRGI